MPLLPALLLALAPQQTLTVPWTRAIDTHATAHDPALVTPAFTPSPVPPAAAVLTLTWDWHGERYVELVHFPSDPPPPAWSHTIPPQPIRLSPWLKSGSSVVWTGTPAEAVLPGLADDDWTGRFPDGELDYQGAGGHVYRQDATVVAQWVVTEAGALAALQEGSARPLLACGQPWDTTGGWSSLSPGSAEGAVEDLLNTARRQWAWTLEYVPEGDPVPDAAPLSVSTAPPGPPAGALPWDGTYPPPGCSSCWTPPQGTPVPGWALPYPGPDEWATDAQGRVVWQRFDSRDLWRSPFGGRGIEAAPEVERVTWSVTVTPRGTARIEALWIARSLGGPPYLPTADWMGLQPWSRIDQHDAFAAVDLAATGALHFASWPAGPGFLHEYWPALGRHPEWMRMPEHWWLRGHDGLVDGAGHSGREWSLEGLGPVTFEGEAPNPGAFAQPWSVDGYSALGLGRAFGREWDPAGDFGPYCCRDRNYGVWWAEAEDVAGVELVVGFGYP